MAAERANAASCNNGELYHVRADMSSVNMFLTLGNAVRSGEGQKTGKREGGEVGGGEGIVYRSRYSLL